MKLYKNIVGIIGAPRSGTSWTGQIFDSAPDVLYRMQPFYSYAFRDKIHVRSTREEINRFFRDVYQSKDAYLEQEERKHKGVYPIFEEKNENPDIMVFKEVFFHYLVPVLLENIEELKIIALVRHPIDVLSSYYNAPREFDPTLDIQDEWYFAHSRNELLPERYFGYHKWKEYMKIVSVIKERYPDRVNVVKYEELSANPEQVVQRLFSYGDIPFKMQTRQFIYDSQHQTVNDPYSVFRNKDEKRERRILPENILEQIHKDLENFDEAKEYGYQ